jgi:FkbM family methyltransferase
MLLPRPARKFIKKFIEILLPGPDFFLRKVSGVIHVGAHVGQERDLYARYGLNVLWLEPNPQVFERLAEGIKDYPAQKALPYLATDVEGKEYTFFISSNEGASSSILAPGEVKELWPEVTFTKTIALKSVTLSSLVARGEIEINRYDGLVMDTQGSELLVLKGAMDLLDRFKFIKTEASDFEVYKGCCQLADLDTFLKARGFKRVRTKRFAHQPGVGSCYDVTYQRIAPA